MTFPAQMLAAQTQEAEPQMPAAAEAQLAQSEAQDPPPDYGSSPPPPLAHRPPATPLE